MGFSLTTTQIKTPPRTVATLTDSCCIEYPIIKPIIYSESELGRIHYSTQRQNKIQNPFSQLLPLKILKKLFNCCTNHCNFFIHIQWPKLELLNHTAEKHTPEQGAKHYLPCAIILNKKYKI